MVHYSLCVSTVSMLADPLQPTWTFRITKKGKLLMEHTDLGILSAMHGESFNQIRISF